MEIDKRLDDIEEDEEEEGGWLTSYSDLVTDLLAIFVILFSFAMLSHGMTKEAGHTSPLETSQVTDGGAYIQGGKYATAAEDGVEAPDEFDRIFLLIKKKIEESGYQDSILIEKNEEYIKFRFKDSVLFYPDSPVMRASSSDILQYMGDVLMSVNDSIHSVEIGGHTATMTGGKVFSIFSWELSSDRAIAVLKFLVQKCEMPESKMVVSGYSHHQSVATNEEEEGRVQNRRVEIKITRIDTTKTENEMPERE